MAGTRRRYKGPPGKPKVTERWPRAGARIQTWWLSVQILGEKGRENCWFEVGFNRWVGNLHKRWVRKLLSLSSIHTIPEGATSAVQLNTEDTVVWHQGLTLLLEERDWAVWGPSSLAEPNYHRSDPSSALTFTHTSCSSVSRCPNPSFPYIFVLFCSFLHFQALLSFLSSVILLLKLKLNQYLENSGWPFEPLPLPTKFRSKYPYLNIYIIL